jgi:hypothetical protein
VEIVTHISEEDLEQYARKGLSRLQIGLLKQHIQTCPECRIRQHATAEYEAAIQWASAKIDRRVTRHS